MAKPHEPRYEDVKRYPAEQRDYPAETTQWLPSPFQYAQEEIDEINRLYGWEKYRLVSQYEPRN